MTLSISDAFEIEGTRVSLSLPKNYQPQKAYPTVFLNDGDLDRLSMLADKMILVGLVPEQRLDAYTPWKAKALRPGVPDFGGGADRYHQILFHGIIEEVSRRYKLDRQKLAYGGFSLGGLAAIYSLSCGRAFSCLFSICGSFWYPGFVAYCKSQLPKEGNCLIYLQNGEQEGRDHKNRLAQAPAYARTVHQLLQQSFPNLCSVFDSYGHHEALEERYRAFSYWLLDCWQIV